MRRSRSTRASSFVKTKPLEIYSTIKKSLLFPQSSCHPLFLLLAFPYHVIIYPTWSSPPLHLYLTVTTLPSASSLSFLPGLLSFSGDYQKTEILVFWARETLDNLITVPTLKTINDLYDDTMEKKFPSILPIWSKWFEEWKELFTKQRFSFLSIF